MPLDKFWIPLLTMFLILHQTTTASGTTELIRAVGGSVTFHIQDTSGGEAGAWNFGNVPIVSVSFKDPSKNFFFNGEFEKRFAVSKNGRALSISQLRLDDSGNYSVNINGKISTFTLHVYGELSEPRVTCEAQNCSSEGSCRFSLRCSASGSHTGMVTYMWRAGDQPWGEGPMVVLVNKSTLEEPEPVTCTARNPVSSRNVTVTTPDMLCTETATHPPGPGALSGSGVMIWLIATIGVAVLSLGLLLLFLHKFKCWKFRLFKPNLTNTEALSSTVYAEVGSSQQCAPNRIKAKPTDGESPSTVYSLVKRPEQVKDEAAENGTVIGLELV